MSYQYITKHTSPNQNARPKGARPRFIVIHYWGSKGQKFDNVVSWLCNGNRPNRTSAHYVAEAGKVACIVDPDRRAWHAGSNNGNDYGIGIECRPEATDGDYATVAELIARLRKVYGDLPLRPHRAFTSTDCPGPWNLDRLDRLARGQATAQAAPAKPAPAKPAKVTSAPEFPLPRGYYYGPASGPKASVSGRTANSAVPRDVTRDARGRYRSIGLYSWQKRMRDRTWSIGVDGRYGDETAKVARQFQKSKGLAVDGKIGPATWAAAWTEPVV